MGIIQMKKAIVLKSSLLFLSALCLPFSIAQDFPQWGLPEGAKARLGKGIIREIQYSPDGTRLAVASSIGIWIYDTATHQEIALLTGHTHWVRSVAFSPDGNTIASGSWGRIIRLWGTLFTGEHQQTIPSGSRGIGIGSVALRLVPMETPSLVAGADRTIGLWNADTGEHLQTLTGHTIRSVALRLVPMETPSLAGVGAYHPAVERHPEPANAQGIGLAIVPMETPR